MSTTFITAVGRRKTAIATVRMHKADKASVVVLLLTVVLAASEGTAPPPEAVAILVIDTAVMSVWVT